ncbi:LysR family transcriptional regulator [Chenggangzhangella methanolivorans]|uniref:LysR family transcriptional regulator n=1 Tax=Chenggangzhangella methanolivorans TaxID=1437009 RepID=A0A9E6RI86_9HYPH|nr:LysR family transcriptional regulator [Chenggangzhangella methanolivorans]QZO01492.1 LysR family transcriptional regulator [Chenggangzhangella methanolivorans]
MIAELRTLVAVARHGTFTGAGERIGLTQAAVSGHVKRLEERLGFELFERTGRSARLNAAGLRTVDRARRIIELVDGLGAPEGSEAEARLRVGAIASVQATLLAAALGRFRALRPKTHVRVVPGVSLHLLDQLDAGDLDMAVIVRPPFDLPPRFAWRTAVREPIALLVPQAVEGDDWRALVRSQPFVRYDRTSFGGRQVDALLRVEGLEPSEAAELDELPAIAAMVAVGVGVALAPVSPFGPPPPPGVRVVAVGPSPRHRELGVVCDALTDGGPASTLIELVVEAAADRASAPG